MKLPILPNYGNSHVYSLHIKNHTAKEYENTYRQSSGAEQSVLTHLLISLDRLLFNSIDFKSS